MTIYKQGEVVLVPFPFSDLSQAKKRPALVVSANWYNRCGPDCVLIGITSTVHSTLEPDEVLIQKSEVKQAGLLFDSVVKTGKIFTIQQNLVVKSLGTLPSKTMERILYSLQNVIAR
jgi:mRNA interferase MazF